MKKIPFYTFGLISSFWSGFFFNAGDELISISLALLAIGFYSMKAFKVGYNS